MVQLQFGGIYDGKVLNMKMGQHLTLSPVEFLTQYSMVIVGFRMQ